MDFRILGSLEAVADGRVVAPDAAKPRALLAILLLHAGEPVSRDRLIEDLWDGSPPATAAKVLQTYVSQLRKALGSEVIVTRPSGYELVVEADGFDLHRFERLVAEAGASKPAVAAARLREALSLWRGPPLADFLYERWAQADIGRLIELRLSTLQDRLDADLALGRDGDLVGELERLVSEYPLSERLRGQLMLALYRSGRQADALAAYRDARRALVDALGIEPTLVLRQLERRILDQDPSLDHVTAEPSVAGATRPGPSLQSRSSSFVGRTRELREIGELLRLEDVRLLTLTGAAGSGKTRLALEVTSALEGEPTGAVVVELGRITDARLVARAIAGEFKVKERPGQRAREALLEFLHDRRTLLLLDNFEHVLSAAPLVRELLAGAPGVRVLVTSRAPLDVPEERVYQVPALELPDPSRRTSLARLRRTEAIRLFLDRAQAARPDFELSETNALSVVELCVRLDGLPLALELAAARCNVLSPRALLERLDSRLDLLRAAPGSGVSERQWTLRAAIEWSYELLAPAQQQLFTSLGVFVGGFTLGAAELVADRPDSDILEGVDSLLRNNLLTTEHARGDEPRLGMLETIREYALERLAARGDGEAVRRRHADFCLVLAEQAEPGLLGPEQREWLERLDAERHNIRAALSWALQAGEADVGLRIGYALWRYWQVRSHVAEGRERMEDLLALGSGSPAARAKAQTQIANLALNQGDLETARRMLDESLEVHRQTGDDRMVATALGLRSVVTLRSGDIDTALAETRETLDAARRAGHAYMESAALWQVGVCLAARGELDEAERTLAEAVDLARRLGDARSVGNTQRSRAGVALMCGDQARAWRLFDESLTISRSLDDATCVSHSLSHLASLALETGDAEAARTRLSEALAIERESGDHIWLAITLETSARLAAGDGQPALATRLYARAALLREVTGVWLNYELGRPDPAPTLAALRSRIGEAAFAEQWERGRAMGLLEAIDQASRNHRELEPGHVPQADEQSNAASS